MRYAYEHTPFGYITWTQHEIFGQGGRIPIDPDLDSWPHLSPWSIIYGSSGPPAYLRDKPNDEGENYELDLDATDYTEGP